jgi:hypothetical protein
VRTGCIAEISNEPNDARCRVKVAALERRLQSTRKLEHDLLSGVVSDERMVAHESGDQRGQSESNSAQRECVKRECVKTVKIWEAVHT